MESFENFQAGFMERMLNDCLDCLSSTVQMNFESNPDRTSTFPPKTATDESLQEFANAMAIETSELEGRAKASLRKLLSAIHDHSGCPINRFCVSGSCGHQPDNVNDGFGFDITVYVDCEASHGQVEPRGSVEHMQCSIQSAEHVYRSLRGLVEHSTYDHFGMHFTLDNYDFNVAVTPCLGRKMHLQRKAVWDLVEQKDKEIRLSQSDLDMMSISLHESLTAFMHMGDPVFHDLVRLARFWRQTALVDQGCGELSTLATILVMMRCIEDEKARGMSVSSPSGRGLTRQVTFPVKNVFKDFLTTLSEFDNQVITYQRFYEPDLIPERHLGTKPCILDPVNPWRNVVHNMTKEGVEWVKRHAWQSLKVLNTPNSTIADVFMLPTSQRVTGL
jgi:hypothetical protein